MKSPDRLAPLAKLLQASKVPMSRRDAFRVAATLGAAAAMPLVPIQAQNTSARQDDAKPTETLNLAWNLYGQAFTLDPHQAPNWGPFWVTLPYLWSGLLRFDENGAVEPDLAEKVEPNKDGTVWTATLRENLAYANGDPIVAEDFITSWKRALNPSLVSPMMDFLAPIKGARSLANGSGQDFGVVAKDDRTLEISLDQPMSHFPAYLATFVYAAVNPKYFADKNPIELKQATSGPWRVIAQSGETAIRFGPNKGSWVSPSTSVKDILWRVVPTGQSDAVILNWYTRGIIDIGDASPAIIDKVRNNKDISGDLTNLEDSGTTLAFAMDFQQKPFNDPKMRKALALSVDRATWSADVQKKDYLPASSMTPPVLKTITSYDAPKLTKYDAEAAKQALEDAKYDPDATPIVLYIDADLSEEHKLRAAGLVDMIKAASGLVIDIDSTLTADQIDAAREDKGGSQIALVEWWNDSTTPSLLNTIAGASSPFNVGFINWTTEIKKSDEADPGKAAGEFDTKVHDAIAEMDLLKRNKLFLDAETLLLDNAVYVPIGHRLFWFMMNSAIKGVRQGPWSGSTPVRVDSDVTIERAAE